VPVFLPWPPVAVRLGSSVLRNTDSGARAKPITGDADGTKIGLTVRVTSVKGDHVSYHFQVDKK
jgi:hypothetical protein